MGYPFFSWYPLHSMSPRIEIINFGEDLSDLQVTPKRDVVDSFSLMGGRSRELLRPWVEVRVVLDRFTDRKLFRQLSAMINHLERGGSVAFGNDHQKIWMARTERISQGATSVLHGANVGGGYYDGSTPVLSTLSSPDEIVIETGAPLAKREYHTVSSASASQINLGESLDTFDDPMISLNCGAKTCSGSASLLLNPADQRISSPSPAGRRRAVDRCCRPSPPG